MRNWITVIAVLWTASSTPADWHDAMDRIQAVCIDCHQAGNAEGGLDLEKLSVDLSASEIRERWIRIHDRIAGLEMPPEPDALEPQDRQIVLEQLERALNDADRAAIVADGRGPMRRLNRDEYEQNLRDLLELPHLDIRDMLPPDREKHLFTKTSAALDISRVQLAAYLDAADAALRQAIASGANPPPVTSYRAISIHLFPENSTFGEREAMFFAKDNQAIDTPQLESLRDDPSVELALFRSAHWPYYGYPRGFIASLSGAYRVRFSARAVVQTDGYRLLPAAAPVPMTFRARKPSGPDVSGDVRATGGMLDIQPEVATYETVIRLREGETFEYSLLGLPVPLARNVDGGPPTYRYPPFPEGGQPGVAFQWLEVEGPLPPSSWPPPSHRVLFDELGPSVASTQPVADAKRLLRRFIQRAARQPLSEQVTARFEDLVLSQLEQGAPFVEAMLSGYQAFLCSGHFLYLHEPEHVDDHHAIASRLSHFLTNTRPDARLLELAERHQLRDAQTLREETDRLITSDRFEAFVESFTAEWLNLRHLRRDEPDIRLYPEYRFDDYLVESMARETRAFFATMIRENLSARSLVDCDFVLANDRLSQHYGLAPARGSAMRKLDIPQDSPLGGLLTQAAIMKVTANGSSTSPVIRGAWIMERLLGQPPPPPPASVPAVEPDLRGAETIRDLLALHTKSESCAGCHARFDPVGLALENFDILGGWRSRYRGMEKGDPVIGIDRAGHDYSYTIAEPVDASGQLLDGRSFQDVRDLKRLLSEDPRQLARNLLQQFIVYSTGTPVRFSDRQEVESMLDACQEQDYRVRDLLHALVHSKIFLGQDGTSNPTTQP